MPISLRYDKKKTQPPFNPMGEDIVVPVTGINRVSFSTFIILFILEIKIKEHFKHMQSKYHSSDCKN